VSTFAHLKHVRCLTTPYEPFDVGIIGAPFDTAVSYRPGMLFPRVICQFLVFDLYFPYLLTPLLGARFGPRAIRAASARQISHRSFNTRAGINPFTSWPHILDCGDIPITPFDNALALRQMTEAYLELLSRRPLSFSNPISHVHPKLITLGGDHSVALPALRALQKTYRQPIAVLHFDAHMVSTLVFTLFEIPH
jgi:agmatinase